MIEHGYGENILNVHLTNPGYGNEGIAWFDFGNSFYTYFSFHSAAPWDSKLPLPASLTRERLALLKRQFLAGFEAYWEARSYSASAEHSGLWSVIHTAVTGQTGLEDPLWMVRRGPRELLDWGVRNSQRLDVELRKDWLDCCNASLAVTPCACHHLSPRHPVGSRECECWAGCRRTSPPTTTTPTTPRTLWTAATPCSKRSRRSIC